MCQSVKYQSYDEKEATLTKFTVAIVVKVCSFSSCKEKGFISTINYVLFNI